MKTILKFYIEVLVASIVCAIFGLISLFRIDFIRPDGVVFVYLPVMFPLVVIAMRYGLRGAGLCALLGGILFYVAKGGNSLTVAEFTEIFLSLGFASLAGLFKTYSRPSIRRILGAAVTAEGLRLLGLSIGAAFYSGAFDIKRLEGALIDNTFFLVTDLGMLLILLSLAYYLTKGGLYEYKI